MATFSLNSREPKSELKGYNTNILLPLCRTSNYLGVKLNRLLLFCLHIVALRKKLSSHVTLLRQLVGSGCTAGVKTLQTAALSLVYPTVEICAAVCYRSAHICLIDSVLNDALRVVLGAYVPLHWTTYLYLLASNQLSFAD